MNSEMRETFNLLLMWKIYYPKILHLRLPWPFICSELAGFSWVNMLAVTSSICLSSVLPFSHKNNSTSANVQLCVPQTLVHLCLLLLFTIDIQVPFGVIFGGTDINEDVKVEQKRVVMEQVLRRAR